VELDYFIFDEFSYGVGRNLRLAARLRMVQGDLYVYGTQIRA
jgi:hypothetical protein